MSGHGLDLEQAGHGLDAQRRLAPRQDAAGAGLSKTSQGQTPCHLTQERFKGETSKGEEREANQETGPTTENPWSAVGHREEEEPGAERGAGLRESACPGPGAKTEINNEIKMKVPAQTSLKLKTPAPLQRMLLTKRSSPGLGTPLPPPGSSSGGRGAMSSA